MHHGSNCRFMARVSELNCAPPALCKKHPSLHPAHKLSAEAESLGSMYTNAESGMAHATQPNRSLTLKSIDRRLFPTDQPMQVWQKLPSSPEPQHQSMDRWLMSIHVQVDQLVFQQLVDAQFPTLAQRLQAQAVNVAAVSTQWFLCAFVNSLPLETCLRVWDLFFLTRCASALFRIALALVDIYSLVRGWPACRWCWGNSEAFRGEGGTGEILGILEHPPMRLSVVHAELLLTSWGLGVDPIASQRQLSPRARKQLLIEIWCGPKIARSEGAPMQPRSSACRQQACDARAASPVVLERCPTSFP